MAAYVDYYKVGKIEEIVKSGWKTTSIFGRDIIVIFCNKEFFAIERGGLFYQSLKAYLPEGRNYSRSGVKYIVDKFLLGPQGTPWGKLRYFPVRIEEEHVLVGITH
jgi:hypothetical protein